MNKTSNSFTPETAAEAEWLTGTFSEGTVKGRPKRAQSGPNADTVHIESEARETRAGATPGEISID